MPETLEDFLMKQSPTAERPLLGQTIMIVEDSRYASDALRIICQKCGARIRRADTLASAERHLRMYRPGIALIDVGLPDGSGLELVRHLATGEPRIGVIMVMSGDDAFAPEAALEAGANGFIAKPIQSIQTFTKLILSELPADARPIELRPVGEDSVTPDTMGLRDDLALAAELLQPGPDAQTLDYVTNFLIGVSRSADDTPLQCAVRDVETARGAGGAAAAEVADLKDLIDARLSEASGV
ncbi:MAG: response regulator [Pseudomonadota bacterium]